jgi:hypothetical protein
MNTATESPETGERTAAPVTSPVRLCDIALAAVAETCPDGADAQRDLELRLLRQITSHVRGDGACPRSLIERLHEVARRPDREDAALVWLAKELRLTHLELLAIALAAAVDHKPLVGRLLSHVQAPIAGSRPTLGLLAQAFQTAFDPRLTVLRALLNGAAIKSGLLIVLNENAPLPERPIMVPGSICLALMGDDSRWPGVTIGLPDSAGVLLPDSTLAQAARHAHALGQEDHRALVIRTASAGEGRSAALAIAKTLNRRPAFIDGEVGAGLGPWLLLRRVLPVLCLELAPAERRRMPDLPGYCGPIVAVCGPDGSVESSRGAAANWTLPVPSQVERRALWLAALGNHRSSRPDVAPNGDVVSLAEQLAHDHRHGAGRIAQLGRLIHHHAALAGRASPDRSDVIAAAWFGEGSSLDALAEPLRAHVPDDALVVPPALRADLETLTLRCRMRDDLAEGLGASARTRYRPGVRALFTGPSGTGKTLAAGWIAARLGLPLYRVDLASVTSKYIGETEKNLSQLLSRAEQAEVILLFDEADSLFGKRTDIGDANDRFANAQTNYLLQRIENYDGIVLLTSNSQARFDEAFTRRLDAIVEFPIPGPEERRALWKSHLGTHTPLKPAELNRLAVLVDLTGGHIRNAVLAAAVHARGSQCAIEYKHLLAGLEGELRKLGRQVPIELQPRS